MFKSERPSFRRRKIRLLGRDSGRRWDETSPIASTEGLLAQGENIPPEGKAKIASQKPVVGTRIRPREQLAPTFPPSLMPGLPGLPDALPSLMPSLPI